MTNKILTVSFTNNPQPKATEVTIGREKVKVTGPAADASKTLIEGAVNRVMNLLTASSKEEHKERLRILTSLQQFIVTVVPVDAIKTDIIISDGSDKLSYRVHLHSGTAAALKKAFPQEAPQNSQAAPQPKQSIMRSRADFPPTDPFTVPAPVSPKATTPTPAPVSPKATTPTPAPVARFFLFALFATFFAWIGRGISSLFSSSEEELPLVKKADARKGTSAAAETNTSYNTTHDAKIIAGVRPLRNGNNICFINAAFQAVMNMPQEIKLAIINAHETKIAREAKAIEALEHAIAIEESSYFLPWSRSPRRAALRELEASREASITLNQAIRTYNNGSDEFVWLNALRGFIPGNIASGSQQDANEIFVQIFDPLLEPLQGGLDPKGKPAVGIIPENVTAETRARLGRFLLTWGEEKQLAPVVREGDAAVARNLELNPEDRPINDKDSVLPPYGRKKEQVASSLIQFTMPDQLEHIPLQTLVTSQLTMSPPSEQDGEAVYVHNNVRADYQVTQKRIAIESLGVNPPEFVSLQVKRFGSDPYGHTYRVNTPIQLPADNKLKLIINEKEETFEIQSIVSHIGGISGGHYFSYLRKEAGWVEGNDSTVTPLAQLPKSVERDVYMLVLKRVP